jgi:hypothetical protein
VAGRRGVEDDRRVPHRLDLAHQFRKAHRLCAALRLDRPHLHRDCAARRAAQAATAGGLREGERRGQVSDVPCYDGRMQGARRAIPSMPGMDPASSEIMDCVLESNRSESSTSTVGSFSPKSPPAAGSISAPPQGLG